ncbi:MAG: hypothetical protein A4E19_08090 [Nitrospira sp. SG-bin1]|nr:MAG: hypothetical protein A4E19_08090 [Nitrospira sp. SG-bin1]
MSYRYNTIDIIVGVGMCAILFGGLLLFLAANGTYQMVPSQVLSFERQATIDGMSILQPALGQAIVDQALLERRTNHAVAQSASEWNHATLAYHDWQSGSRGLLGAVLNQAATVPINHLARVEGIKGRAVVNFTKRGVRNGLVSADQYGTMYNMKMIGAIEAQGQRLHDEFASTWQATLGRRIVEAAHYDWLQTGAIQERLGSALVQVVHAQMNAEQGRAAQQEQLASLIFAAVRHEVVVDRPTQAPTAMPTVTASEDIAMGSTEPVSWPDIPMGYLMAAGLLLTTIFLGGLTMAAQSREAKALAQLRRDVDRWAFRMAA